MPGRTTLALDGNSATLQLRGEGLWAPPVLVSPKADDYRVSAHRTGRVTAQVRFVGEKPAPSGLEVRFASGKGEGRMEGEVPCVVQDRVLSACELPVGVSDLRLSADSWVPQYLWGVEIGVDQAVDLGQLQFERGASLAGWVEVVGDQDQIASAVAKLRPATGASLEYASDSDRERLSFRQYAAKPAPNGFLQFKGLRPGTFRLEVEAPGLTLAVLDGLEIAAGQETFIDQALRMEAPLALTVVVDPPFAPWGEPWTAELFKRRCRGAEQIAIAEVDFSGSWNLEGLAPGNYLVVIKTEGDDGRGVSRWAEEEIELERSAMHPVGVEIVEVEGELKDQEGPIPANLWFGGRNGLPSITFISDRDGEFHGYLPREGLWEVEIARDGRRDAIQRIEAVEVAALEPGQPARVTIELSAIGIHGSVVDAEGEPIGDASVLLVSTERQTVEGNVLADSNGEFEFSGLRSGPVQLSAYTARGNSDLLEIELTAERPDEPVTLTVQGRTAIRGVVRGPGGPVAGAAIRAFAPQDMVETTLSGPEGRFEIEVSQSPEARLIVIAPGHAAWWRTVSTEAEPADVDVHLHGSGGRLKLDLGSHATATLRSAAGSVSIAALAGGPVSGETLTPLLAPDTYSVCTSPFGTDCQQVQVFDGSTEEVDLAVGPGSDSDLRSGDHGAVD